MTDLNHLVGIKIKSANVEGPFVWTVVAGTISDAGALMLYCVCNEETRTYSIGETGVFAFQDVDFDPDSVLDF